MVFGLQSRGGVELDMVRLDVEADTGGLATIDIVVGEACKTTGESDMVGGHAEAGETVTLPVASGRRMVVEARASRANFSECRAG